MRVRADPAAEGPDWSVLPSALTSPPGTMDRSLRATLRRRVVSFGLLGLAWMLVILMSPLLLAGAALIDLATRRPAPLVRLVVFAIVFLSCEVLGVISVGVWKVVHALRGGDRRSLLEGFYTISLRWLSTLISTTFRLFRFQVNIEGPEREWFERPVLLLCRHQSTTDTLFPGYFIQRPFGVMLRYVLKRELIWEPCLDVWGSECPNYFVDRGGHENQVEIDAIAELGRGLAPGEAVVLFPEGTRHTPQKRRRILQRYWRQGDRRRFRRVERLHHVLPPRPGGALALVAACPGADVVFCAHTGLEGLHGFHSLLEGNNMDRTVDIRFWRVRREDIPEDPAARLDWLFDQWEKVEDFVADHTPMKNLPLDLSP